MRGKLQRHHADGAGTLDDHRVARLNAGVDGQGLGGNAGRLGERGMCKGDILRDAVQDRRAYGHIAGHGAVNQVAVALAMRAHVIGAGQAVGALAADKGCRLHRHAVTFRPTPYVLAHVDDGARPLVPQDYRALDRPTLILVPEMDVAAADTDCAYFHQHLIRADHGLGDFLHCHIAGLPPVLHHCTHSHLSFHCSAEVLLAHPF